MSNGFENQISAFYDNYILFYTLFCQGTFFVTVLWKINTRMMEDPNTYILYEY